ncbi:hypothetical protein ACSS6W_000505 [Trichoderma asperelloides]
MALTCCGIPRPNPLSSNLTTFCHEAIRGNLFLMIAICARIIAARAVWSSRRKRDRRNKTRACMYDAHIQTQTWESWPRLAHADCPSKLLISPKRENTTARRKKRRKERRKRK